MSKIFLSIASGPGMALSTAKRFAREGYDIVLSSRSVEKLRPCAAEIEKLGAKVEVRQIDASDARAVAKLVESIGPDLHVVHYNGAALHFANGRLLTRTLDDETLDSLLADLNTSAISALAAIKAATGAMKARGSGTLLITGGGFCFAPSGDYLTLSLGKVALRTMTQTLFEQLKKQNIHVFSAVICQYVTAGSKDAEEVAEMFWRNHAQPREEWKYEEVFGNLEEDHA
ncbi:SDR family NAD(P)-dependent oxidoreductase [Ramlibacter sp.]|uniref:SDR family NAD(P)-dependent oxidoreductase n=1 Tax=Ramlibacter sp. TaxID=1917967 RepID=UPI003D0D8A2B